MTERPPAQPVGATKVIDTSQWSAENWSGHLMRYQGNPPDPCSRRMEIESALIHYAESQTLGLKQQLAEERERWRDWKRRIQNCWANDYRATMTALIEDGPLSIEELRRVSTVAPQGKASGVPCPKSQDGIRETE